VISAIMSADPPPISTLQSMSPPALDHVVRSCLAKEPDARWQTAHDVLLQLKWIAEAGSGSSPGLAAKTAAADRAWRHSVPVTIGIATLGIVLAVFFARRTPVNPAPQLLASILPPRGEGFWANLTQPAAISPNGVFLALIAMRSGQTQLWVRRLDSPEAQPLAGTEGAANPFWSPDSRHLGFFANGKLKKVDVSGGAVSNICPTGFASMGGTWSSRGVILFSAFADRLKRVSDTGSTPELVSGLAPSSDTLGQYWPSFLPDGIHFLYLEWRYHSPDNPDNVVWLGSLDGEKPQRLPLTSTNVEYSACYLLFGRDGDLLAQRFDLEHLELRGPAQPVARSMQYDSFFDNAAFTVSNNGILVFGAAGTGVNSELTWMDRTGAVMGVLGEPNQFLRQSISPDARHVAVGVKPAVSHDMVWIYDVERGTRIPLDPGITYSPRWSWDGKQVAYRITGGKASELYVRASDGSGEARQIGGKFNGVVTVEDWSPNNRYLVFTFSISTGSQNWKDSLQVVPVAGEAKAMFAINEAHGAKFSPDGNWLAYHDNTSGQVYVTRFPGPGGRIAVSSSGGGEPRWRGDGQELIYVSDDQTLFSVEVRETSQEFRVLSSRPLFHFALPGNEGFYHVTRDGKRFLVNTRTHKEQSAALTVVTNWSSMLQAH